MWWVNMPDVVVFIAYCGGYEIVGEINSSSKKNHKIHNSMQKYHHTEHNNPPQYFAPTTILRIDSLAFDLSS